MSKPRQDKLIDRARAARKAAIAIGTLGLLASLIGALLSSSEKAFRSYLFAYLFWLELGIGSTAFLMIAFLTDGEWGRRTRRILEAANRTQLALAILFVPVLVGVKKIYPWTDQALVASDRHLQHKALYLNIPFFCVRAVFYLACWVVVSIIIDRLSQKQRHERGKEHKARLRALSAGGLVLYSFTASFAAMDWQMSLEPRWYSTIYGMIFGLSQLLAAWAFTLVTFSWIVLRGGAIAVLSKKIMRDLGNILLMLIIVWTYLSFMQYLIIWSGNLPHEVTWALRRIRNGWQWLGLLIAVFQFGAPFFLLLFRPIKTHPMALAFVGMMLLVISVVDRYWQATPALHERLYLDWFALTNFLGIGGLWLALFLGKLLERPISIEPEATGNEVAHHA